MKKIKVLICLLIFVVVFSLGVYAVEYDFEGQTVTISPHNEMGHIEEIWEEDPENRAHLEEVEDMFNVDIEFSAYNQDEVVDNIMSDVIAGETTADIYELHDHHTYQLISEGAVLPLNDILDDEYWENSVFGEQGYIWSEYQGEYYSFTGGGQGQGIVWNQSLFEREDLPDIYELWQDGEWTIEVFREIALDATDDTSGDGEIDQWGFGMEYNEFRPGCFLEWIYANGGSMTKKEGNRVIFSADEKPAIEAIELIQELHEQEAYPEDKWARNRFQDGNLAMLMHNTYLFPRFMDEMEDDFSFVPLPKGENQEKHVSAPSGWNLAFIPLTTDQDAEALIALYSALYETHSDYADIEALEEENKERFMSERAPDRETVEAWEYITSSENQVPIRYWQPVFMPDLMPSLERVVFDGESATSVISEIEPMIQENLDEILN